MGMETKRRFLDTDYDEASIHPEILPAVKALRNCGVETIASHSGIGQIGVDDAWGSYIKIRLFTEDGFEIAGKINEFAQALSARLQQGVGNSELTLQLVSAEEWYKDRNTTSIETRVPIYRLQLVGQTNDDEIRYAWRVVSENFTPEVLRTSNSSNVQ